MYDTMYQIMKYKAVIFDLFGTLVDRLSEQENAIVRKQVASVLSISLDDFNRLWSDSLYKRSAGVFKSVRENIEYIGQTLGVPFEASQVTLATELRYDLIKRAMVPRADAIEVITSLKLQGCKIGLICNCTPDVPIIWKETQLAPLFDTRIFSCIAGIEKPDFRIYNLALDQLAVEPAECLYVDDNLEPLRGAERLGMTGVLIRTKDGPERNSDPFNQDNWVGPVIASLTEVLELVK